MSLRGPSYDKKKYCGKCTNWHDKIYQYCPDCKMMLRCKPRNSKTRKLYA